MIKNQNTQEMILLLGLKKKDDDAFQSLYRDYSKSLLGIILKIIKNTEQAEDILQDTFIQIFSKIDFYDENKSRLFTWMARLARNKSLDYLKSTVAKKKMQTITIYCLSESDIHIRINCLETDLIGIKTLCDNLPAAQMQVINLLFFKGYTQSEAAIILQLPLGTIKSRSRKALICLRDKFEQNIFKPNFQY